MGLNKHFDYWFFLLWGQHYKQLNDSCKQSCVLQEKNRQSNRPSDRPKSLCRHLPNPTTTPLPAKNVPKYLKNTQSRQHRAVIPSKKPTDTVTIQSLCRQHHCNKATKWFSIPDVDTIRSRIFSSVAKFANNQTWERGIENPSVGITGCTKASPIL